jgi:hypothetical protein
MLILPLNGWNILNENAPVIVKCKFIENGTMLTFYKCQHYDQNE